MKRTRTSKKVTCGITLSKCTKRQLNKMVSIVLVICMFVTAMYGYQPMNETKAKTKKVKVVKELKCVFFVLISKKMYKSF